MALSALLLARMVGRSDGHPGTCRARIRFRAHLAGLYAGRLWV